MCIAFREREGRPAEAEEGREGANDADLDGDEAHQQGEHDVPLVQQQADVHAGASGHKEQAQQHPPERPDVRLHLPHQRTLTTCVTS